MSYLLKLILYGLLIYYVIRFFRRGISSLFGGGPDERSRYSGNASSRPEGEVRIENNSRKNGRVSRDEGEYVDFEEIE